MYETVMNFISQHFVITGSFAAMVGGAILKKTGVLKWIRNKASDISTWLGKIGHNFGVLITTKGNELPVVGPFYEYAIEPVLAMVCEVIPGIIFSFFHGITEGLKSDNKEFKK